VRLSFPEEEEEEEGGKKLQIAINNTHNHNIKKNSSRDFETLRIKQ